MNTKEKTHFAKNLIIALLLIVMGGVLGYKFRGNDYIPGITPIVKSMDNLKNTKITNTDTPVEYKDVDFSQFWHVWQTLEAQYLDVEKIDRQKMMYGAIQGMTSALGDPYTVYLPPVDQKRTKEELSGAFFGVGIQLGYVNEVLAVSAPLKGSPAERAGVKAKDLILHVKDEAKNLDKDTRGWTLQEAVEMIRGEKGTKVTLTLMREGKEQPFQVTLERDEIIVASAEVKYEELNGKRAAHITLSRFGDRTVEELNQVIQDISKQSPKVDGVILDMRNNPGGYLQGAIEVSGEFIKSGLVVTQKGKYSSKDYMAEGQSRLSNMPVIVVVNGGSASASEIVAGALRDRREAKLVGQKTFGKGTVQDAMEFENGAGLHVTIARWLLPKGEWIHDTGIPVNVEVEDDPNTENDEVIDRAKQELFNVRASSN